MSENILNSNTDAWSTSIDQTSKNKTYTFLTQDSYVDKNISMTVNVHGVELSTGDFFWIRDGNDTLHIFKIDTDGNLVTINNGFILGTSKLGEGVLIG